MTTVRDATLEVLRRLGMTRMFSNPGSTEVAFLAHLPADFDFVLGLHEASVVGMATGAALATGRPELVLLHTTAGLGNAVGAIATARVNRAPLVVVVGQQDRRHLALEPFLAGQLDGLAGEYPVWRTQPIRAQDVPGAIARAWHEANRGRGPALVIVPMDDWLAEAVDEPSAAPVALLARSVIDPAAVSAVASAIADAERPAIVVGAGTDTADGWTAVVALAERLDCSVWMEPFGQRVGFPQDHRLFAGQLPADRVRLRAALGPHDLVLVLGAAAFRQYPYIEGPFVPPATRVVVVSADTAETNRSPVSLAVVADPGEVAAALARLVDARPPTTDRRRSPPPRLAEPRSGDLLRAAHVFQLLADGLTPDALLVEECPSSRPELHARIAVRVPLGFLSAAMGGLGFAVPAAIGFRLADRRRPVVAVVGDGSSLYCIQALWSAAHYGVGVLFVILANGGYSVMDRLAERHGDDAPVWPRFTEVSVSGLAISLGCAARRIDSYRELAAELEEVLPSLATRSEPLVLEVGVLAKEVFQP